MKAQLYGAKGENVDTVKAKLKQKEAEEKAAAAKEAEEAAEEDYAAPWEKGHRE